MGASTTITHALLTIAAITLAAIFAFTIISKTTSLTSSISQFIFSESQNLKTSITIIEVHYDSSLSCFVIYVKNTGSYSMPLSILNETDVYLGTYGSALNLYTYNPLGGAGHWNYTQYGVNNSSWDVGETLALYLYNSTNVSPPYHVKIVLPSGIGGEIVEGG